MTDSDISFLTVSVTEVDRCCKEIVGIDLQECCLGTEFNLLTVAAYYEGVLDVAGASRVTAPRDLALSHSPKKPHTPVDHANEPVQAAPAPSAPAPAAPALAGVRGRAGARASGVPTQGRGQRRSQRARRWQINLVVLDERCAVVC